MERSIPNNDPQQIPSSPKKKLHTKDKGSLADTITNARASLKNGKDISARNLMECSLRKPPTRAPSFEFDPDMAREGSESTTEEIVALEEEHTDFLSTGGADGFNDDEYDDDESIIEEIVEEYYEEEVVVEDEEEEEEDDHTEGSLEPLPPPIVIPKALRVRDSDEEVDDDDDESDDDDDDDDDDDSLPSVVVPPKKQQQQQQTPNIASPKTSMTTSQPKVEVAQTRKESFSNDAPILAKTSNLSTLTVSTTGSPVVAAPSTKAVANSNSVRPAKTEAKVESSGPSVDDELDRKVANDSRASNENDAVNENDANTGSVWEKPDWTKNNRLKATGVSPARNLAKPITQLPELVSKKEMNDIKTPKKSNTMQAKLSLDNTKAASIMKYPKSPKVSTAKVSMTAPKSAPQLDGGRKKYVAPTVPSSKDDICNDDKDDDDEFSSKIAWEKPEWAKKKVLRKTSKTETILSGGKLERPIGGIRPIE